MPRNCLPSVTLAIAVTAALVINCPAQEIGSVDLTEITARTEFRRPPATGKANQARGGAGFDDRFNCPHSVSNIAALRTTLVSLDRSSYQVGDEPRFEVTVENLGPIPLRIPFSPHVADLQPEDPAQKFSYSELQVELWIAGKEWRSNSSGGFSLYGDDDHAGTVLTLKQGEWVRIIGKGKFALPTDAELVFLSAQSVDRAYAEVSLIRDETLLTAEATARVRHKVCIGQTWGRSIPIVLATPQQ
jgi:hypothetical protein